MDEIRKTLLLASSNPGKLAEMQALLKHLPLTLRVQAELDEPLHVPETGSTYAQNARMKAETIARYFGMWALADDTGLEVDVLDGAPGLHSARLLGPGASDADRRARLLELLASEPQPWMARFRCFAALAGPKGELAIAEGLCLGEIIPDERGSHGFGYDPIFKVSGTEKTMAELTPSEKNMMSHRARAIDALTPDIIELLGIKDWGSRDGD